MYDQAFSYDTLKRMIRARDYEKDPSIKVPSVEHAYINSGVSAARSIFNGTNPLHSVKFKGKSICQIPSFANELVIRKASFNFKFNAGITSPHRNSISRNLLTLISEGIPYAIYKLDIEGFYESFDFEVIKDLLQNLKGLNPLTRKLLLALIDYHHSGGGKGVPRGLQISALITEAIMRDFDVHCRGREGIFFYARYVDDIVIIVNPMISKTELLNEIKGKLPKGLKLNFDKVRVILHDKKVNPVKPSKVLALASSASAVVSSPTPDFLFDFDYLGYNYRVYEPLEDKSLKLIRNQFRQVEVDLALSKVKRYKQRIIKSYLDFIANKNFDLLHNRIRFLTSNFSLEDESTGRRKFSGIYFNYPLISNSVRLEELDLFLKNSIFSTKGRVFPKLSALLNPRQKQLLLKYSFVYGHKHRIFFHYSPMDLKRIQECWKYG